MRLIHVLIVLTVFFIAGCSATPTPQPTDPVAAVATQVSIQLTSLPTLTTAPTATQTVEPPTPLPPESTATDIPTATATVPSSDPRLTLGSPSWSETFDSGSSFGLGAEGYSDEQTTIKVESGSLVLSSLNTIGYHGWRTGGPVTPDNAYIEGTFQTGNCAGDDQYGLVFRSPDYVKGYWFMTRCSGGLQFGYWSDSGFTSLFSQSETPQALLTGPGQTNRLGVMAQGNRFVLYVNGEPVHELTDETYPDGGRTGAVIAAYDTAGFTYRLDELAVWNLP